MARNEPSQNNHFDTDRAHSTPEENTRLAKLLI